jgi:copper transport outer membrane protein MctB
MGYSARYHAASLAAVFLALAIGILIGVGLGNKVYKSTRRGLEQSLKSDLAATRGRNETLQAQLNREREFSQQVYPALVGNLLRGQRIAVVALGSLPDSMNGDITSVVGTESPTAAQLREVAVVREPPDLHALTAATPKGKPAHAIARNPGALSDLARRFGRSLITGAPPLARYRDSLLGRISGRPGRIDAVIVVRGRPSNLGPAQSAATDALEAGILDGLERAVSVPVVGVERSDTDPSSIGFYTSSGLPATVDSIDLVSGRVALAYALDGAQGNYGVKATADRLLPELALPGSPPGAGSGPR